MASLAAPVLAFKAAAAAAPARRTASRRSVVTRAAVVELPAQYTKVHTRARILHLSKHSCLAPTPCM